MKPGGTAASAKSSLARPGDGRSRLTTGAHIAALLLLALELSWFVWFQSVRLANGGNIPRWYFLSRALPEVVPGVTFAQSFLGGAVAGLSHLENLPQRLPIVAAATLIGGAALGLGGLILRGLRLPGQLTAPERLALAFGLGTSALGVITLLVGRVGGLSPWPVRIGLAALALSEAGLAVHEKRQRVDSPEFKPTDPSEAPPLWMRLGFWAAVTPFLVLMALGSMIPSIDFDAIEYHLQGPKEYFQAGRISFLPHNVYTSMPFSVEMLHLLGMEVLDDWWWGALVGQLLVAAHAPAAAVMVGRAATRFGSPRAGLFAALVYLTTPWVFRLAVLPYVEGPLGYYHAALVWSAAVALGAADPRLRTRLWAVTGLLAGGAMACKYPALISAVIPFGFISLVDSIRRRSPSTVLAFSLGWALVMTPWLAKNVVDTGNPVYPLGYHVLGGRYWDEAMDQKWSAAHGPRPITLALLGQSVLDVSGLSDWQSSLYVAFAPLAFLRPRSKRFAVGLGLLVVYLFSTWWLLTHRLDRFWLPILAPLAVLAGLGADWTRAVSWSVLRTCLITLGVLGNLAYATTPLTALNEWTGDLTELRISVPRMLNPALAETDASLPPDAKILMVGQAAVFHVRHAIVYNTVFDDETFESLARGRSPEEIHDALKARGISHVFVDWFDIERYRSPGNYGFTPFVQPAEFDRLVKAGVLDAPTRPGERRELYRVRP